MQVRQTTLWSFLIKSEAKREIACSPQTQVTFDAFVAAFRSKVLENRLPASVEVLDVNWDNTDVRQRILMVSYTGNAAPQNVLQFSISVNQMGNFVYVDRRTHIVPPPLHRVRNKKSHITPTRDEKPADRPITVVESRRVRLLKNWSVALSIGGLGIPLVGFLITSPSTPELLTKILVSTLIFAPSGSIITSILSERLYRQQLVEEVERKNAEIDAWNAEADREIRARDAANAKWQAEVLTVAYLSKVDDVLGRWIQALSTTTDQVIQKLFVERSAQVGAWEESVKRREELERELEKRRHEMFG